MTMHETLGYLRRGLEIETYFFPSLHEFVFCLLVSQCGQQCWGFLDAQSWFPLKLIEDYVFMERVFIEIRTSVSLFQILQ